MADTYKTLPPGPPPEKRVMTLELRNLTPTPVVYVGQLLIWEPEGQNDSVTVTVQEGLCNEGTGPWTATHDDPAICTVAVQPGMLDNESRTYTYALSSAGGGADPEVIVKHCIGCP
jgi:hypothetical protein